MRRPLAPTAFGLSPCALGLFAITSHQTPLSPHRATSIHGDRLPFAARLARFGFEVGVVAAAATVFTAPKEDLQAFAAGRYR